VPNGSLAGRNVDRPRPPPAPRPATPSLDPAFVALNRGQLPVRARSGGELAERVRAEDYAVLGARVVGLHTESHATKPTTRASAITHHAQPGLDTHPGADAGALGGAAPTGAEFLALI
jgi:hypothetical protein